MSSHVSAGGHSAGTLALVAAAGAGAGIALFVAVSGFLGASAAGARHGRRGHAHERPTNAKIITSEGTWDASDAPREADLARSGGGGAADAAAASDASSPPAGEARADASKGGGRPPRRHRHSRQGGRAGGDDDDLGSVASSFSYLSDADSFVVADDDGTPRLEPPPTSALWDEEAAAALRAAHDRRSRAPKATTDHISFAAYAVHKLAPGLAERRSSTAGLSAGRQVTYGGVLLTEHLREAAHRFLLNDDSFVEKLKPIYVVRAMANGCPDDVCPMSFAEDLTAELETLLNEYFLRMSWASIDRAYEINAAEGTRKRRNTLLSTVMEPAGDDVCALPTAAGVELFPTSSTGAEPPRPPGGRSSPDSASSGSSASSDGGDDVKQAIEAERELHGGAGAGAQSDAEHKADSKWERLRVGMLKKVVAKRFHVQREFITLIEQLKALKAHEESAVRAGGQLSASVNGGGTATPESSGAAGDASPAAATPRGDSAVGQRRKPVLLLLGGGMAAGKSTVVKHLHNDPSFRRFFEHAVVIEADAFKMADPVFRRLAEAGVDGSRAVHSHSTKAAERLLLSAVRQQRDIVFDGTMSWPPFVEQTVAMVRDHRRTYCHGPGYQVHEDGNVEETYWEVTDESSAAVPREQRQAYHIEMVGVSCDPEIAVARGLRRHLIVGRGVPFKGQLSSHRAFSLNFSKYVDLVDKATLFDTGLGSVPRIIAQKSHDGLYLVHAPSYSRFLSKALINVNTDCFADLYLAPGARGEGDEAVRSARAVWEQWHAAGLDMAREQSRTKAREHYARRQRLRRALEMAAERVKAARKSFVG